MRGKASAAAEGEVGGHPNNIGLARVLRDRRKDSSPMAYIRPIYYSAITVRSYRIEHLSCSTKCTRIHDSEERREIFSSTKGRDPRGNFKVFAIIYVDLILRRERRETQNLLKTGKRGLVLYAIFQQYVQLERGAFKVVEKLFSRISANDIISNLNLERIEYLIFQHDSRTIDLRLSEKSSWSSWNKNLYVS